MDGIELENQFHLLGDLFDRDIRWATVYEGSPSSRN